MQVAGRRIDEQRVGIDVARAEIAALHVTIVSYGTDGIVTIICNLTACIAEEDVIGQYDCAITIVVVDTTVAAISCCCVPHFMYHWQSECSG